MIRILVVDDDPDQLDNLKWAADPQGREVVTAQSATDAIREIKEKDFDVVVTDLGMETMRSGLDVLRAAKERNVFTQVIVITAFGTPAISVEAMKLGAFDYIERNSPGVDVLEMTKSKIDLALKFQGALKAAQSR
jgi:DNA-binding NtrC family response regulator